MVATHTVVTGDTLWAISERHLGSGRNWRSIYEANQEQIEADATAAGLFDPDDPGHWIFPGQTFVLPGVAA